MIHDLKIWTCFFDDVAEGRKTCELRRNDRAFYVGDFLLLREWDPEGLGCYTGREVAVVVTHITRPSGVPELNLLPAGHVALSIRLVPVIVEQPTRRELALAFNALVRCYDAEVDGSELPCAGCRWVARHLCSNAVERVLIDCRLAGLLSEEVAG